MTTRSLTCSLWNCLYLPNYSIAKYEAWSHQYGLYIKLKSLSTYQGYQNQNEPGADNSEKINYTCYLYLTLTLPTSNRLLHKLKSV